MPPRPQTTRLTHATPSSSTEAQIPSALPVSEPTAPALRRRKTPRSVSFALPPLPFPLASFLHPLRSASTQWLVVPAILMVAFLFRWAVALGPYSGSPLISSQLAFWGTDGLRSIDFFRSGSTTNARGL